MIPCSPVFVLAMFVASSTVLDSGAATRHSPLPAAGPLHFEKCARSGVPIRLTASDAREILGEPAALTDSATVVSRHAVSFSCSYHAVRSDSVTGKKGGIYFMYEKYGDAAAAAKAYAAIHSANQGHDGVRPLSGLGDEAYFHSDNENFYFLLARKGPHLIRMKVNKITRFTSLEAFHRIASGMVAAL
jgi:hypothetical protein